MNQATALIVDDEPVARQNCSEWLRQSNCRVFEAESGQQALDIIRREDLDIVVCDVIMPGMNGIELLKRSKAVKADLPFIMISGYVSRSTAMNVVKLGASDYLPKPFSHDVFTQRVHRIIKENALSKQLAPAKGIILGAVFSTVTWILIAWVSISFFLWLKQTFLKSL
jgi:DNA-binding NtrC family response regulator